MRRSRKATLAVGATAAFSLILAGCSGGGSSSGGGPLDQAACDALLSDAPAPTAAPSGSAGSTGAGGSTPATTAQAGPGASSGSSKKAITFVGGAYTTTTEAYWKDLATKFAAANAGYSVNVQVIDWNLAVIW